MRPLLLDTCAVLRLANGEFRKFSASAMKAMREADVLYVSPISEWEIALKWRDGGIELPMPPRDLMRMLVESYSLSLIPLSEEVMFKATELPGVHRDERRAASAGCDPCRRRARRHGRLAKAGADSVRIVVEPQQAQISS